MAFGKEYEEAKFPKRLSGYNLFPCWRLNPFMIWCALQIEEPPETGFKSWLHAQAQTGLLGSPGCVRKSNLLKIGPRTGSINLPKPSWSRGHETRINQQKLETKISKHPRSSRLSSLSSQSQLLHARGPTGLLLACKEISRMNTSRSLNRSTSRPRCNSLNSQEFYVNNT